MTFQRFIISALQEFPDILIEIQTLIQTVQASLIVSSVGKESACNAGDPCSIPGSGRSPEEGIGYPLQYSWAFLVAQLVNNSPAMQRPGSDPWVGKIPWRRERLPTPIFWPGEFQGLYSPRGLKDSNMTEQLSRHRL